MFTDRLRDGLTAGQPYEGLVARAYDAFLPPGVTFPDDAVHAGVIRRCGGPALELGVGNGRFLVPRLEEGLDLEGVDDAGDMLDRCRAHARARGLPVTLHQADMAPLWLDRVYGAICCPAGSFTLIADPARARDAVTSYLRHLAPGGTLSISMFVPTPAADTGWCWRLRRTGTDQHGTTYLAHEATSVDAGEQLLLAYNRIEALDPSGRVVEAIVRKQRLRWWNREQLADLLTAGGFVDLDAVGSTESWVTRAHRPA